MLNRLRCVFIKVGMCQFFLPMKMLNSKNFIKILTGVFVKMLV